MSQILKNNNKYRTFFLSSAVFEPIWFWLLHFYTGKRGRLSKSDLDTGWSKEDERQCSLCQKYGDLKPNVSKPWTSSVKIVDTNLDPKLSTVNTVHIVLLGYKFINFFMVLFTGSRQVALPGPKWVGTCELLSVVSWSVWRGQWLFITCTQCCYKRPLDGWL